MARASTERSAPPRPAGLGRPPTPGLLRIQWAKLALNIASDPTIVTPGVGKLDIFVVGTDGAVWKLSRTRSVSSAQQGLEHGAVRIGSKAATFATHAPAITETCRKA